ncbi:ATP-binding protein [Pseudonocardia sp. TRM90224]|uniref:ATP-binding protein n=1 Tax=Pseudonocardia sp. TRM90224 TaxID=2812678 RepID=UPI001E35BDA6|nr:helix-turn-helix domain-containing protein [Pseudonocardia sp. TRM90224]
MREAFGERLRELRERAGLTQEELAERAELSVDAVSALERGTRKRPYRHTRDALAAALGVPPDERREWDEAIPTRAPLASLPAPANPMLGRVDDVGRVTDLLTRSRLVTITGPGGVGKTRAAVDIAARCAADHADGVVFVALSRVTRPGDVLAAIATALGLTEARQRGTRDALAAHLRRRHLLLVLDNVEHVVDCAPDLADLLAATTRLTLLATSRAPLRIAGEAVHRLDGLAATDAAELFLARAEAATGQAVVDDPELVDELCRRLDRLPLAIELAAAATRLLSPAQQLARLDAVTALRGPRDLEPRQQTVRDTVRWSVELVTDAERELLRAAGVFIGSWSLDAAAAMIGGDPDAVLAQHHGLIEHSLIVRAPVAQPRFGMLETVRAFMLDEAANAGTLDAARDRHAEVTTGLLEAAAPQLWSPDCAETLDELAHDQPNIIAALRHLLRRGDVDRLAAAAHRGWLLWVVRGHLHDLHELATTALRDPQLSATTRSRLHLVAGCTALPRGALAEAAEHCAAAAAIADDSTERAWALIWQATAESYRAAADRAAALVAQARQASADPHAESCAVIVDAHIGLLRGDVAAVDADFTAQLPLVEARGAPWPLAVTLGMAGRTAALLDDPQRATPLLHRSLALFTELRDTWGMAHQLVHVADVAAQRGDFTQAAQLYGAFDAVTEDIGTQVFAVWQDISDRWQATTLHALGIDTFTALRRQGRTMPPTAII